MKKHFSQFILGIAFVLLIFAISNPSQDRHSGKLATTTGIPTMEEEALGERAPYIKTSAMKYHSYFFGSATTHCKSGGVLTIGFLWMVFNFQRNNTTESV
ncbi:MAG: hypothetical protein JNJ77_05105 [Planctomycetia bacterium]|nr:hypothetical protein [Planctomycetia bacterium]